LKSSEPVAPTTVGIKERILYIRQEAAKLLSISVVTSDRLFAKKLIEAGRVGLKDGQGRHLGSGVIEHVDCSLIESRRRVSVAGCNDNRFMVTPG
jgi:hypothetical protein